MFYAKDHANENVEYSAFEAKSARDEFVEAGNRRFNATPEEVKKFCREMFDAALAEAVQRGIL